MTTEWAVSAVANQIALNDQRRGEVTFTVTNLSAAADVAVFEAVTSDNADPSWFTVIEPQRPVPGVGSVSYLVRIAVPPTAAPGRYMLAGRVYSANLAPEETSRSSGWVAFEVAGAKAATPARKRPWWLIPVAAALAVAVLIAGWLVIRPRLVARHGGTIEAEHLLPPLHSDAAAIPVVNCCGVTFSQDRQLLFLATDSGQSVVLRFDMPYAGRYTISTIRTTSWDYGNTILTIDGQQIGGVFDGYTQASAVTGWITEGTVTLTKGWHELTLTVVGRSASSLGFSAGIDAIRYDSA